MRSPIILFLFSAALLTPLAAEPRVWTNAEGSQTFSGEYVAHTKTQVTIRRTGGKEVTLDLSRLHDTDRTWLANQPAGGKDAPEMPADPKAVFDQLCFGDSYETVGKKLKDSKIVVAGVDEVYMGRTGLNGTYRTRQKVGGLNCDLYFDWSAGNTLTEISLRTQGVDKASYDTGLKGSWQELAELLTTLHGKPVQAGAFPGSSSLQNDLFLASHLWQLAGGGSAQLGTSMQGGACMVVVLFTKQRVNPTAAP